MSRNPTTKGTTNEVVIIQQLRGFAALLVVLYHASAKTDWLFNPLPDLHFGIGGVDIFFVISGFVMFVAARHERIDTFWYKRIIRIVPLYWLVTLLFFAMRLPHFGETGTDIPSLVKSLFFIPYRPFPPDGPINPFLVPGWTLNIEMYFYLLFGIGLMVGRPALFSAIFILFAVLAGLILQPHNAAAALYTGPILIEFAIGLGLGVLWARRRYPTRIWPLTVAGITMLLLSDLFGTHAALARGTGAVLAVAGALGVEAGGRVARHPIIKALGDASYSIYLLHTPVLLALRPLFARVPLGGWPQLALFLLLAMVLSSIAGWVLHRAIERPIVQFMRRRTVAGTRVPAT